VRLILHLFTNSSLPTRRLKATAIAKPHAIPVRNCSPFQNQQNAFARSALHLVSQDSASPRASFATHLPVHLPSHHYHLAVAQPQSQLAVHWHRHLPHLILQPSQHPVYSPISRCTRTPPTTQSLAKFRSALTLPPKGYRVLVPFYLSLPSARFPVTAHICAC